MHEDRLATTELDVILKSDLPDFNSLDKLNFFDNDSDINDVSNDDTPPIDTL